MGANAGGSNFDLPVTLGLQLADRASRLSSTSLALRPTDDTAPPPLSLLDEVAEAGLAEGGL
jgi:hypothetical protein